jgi:hypothetical protein
LEKGERRILLIYGEGLADAIDPTGFCETLVDRTALYDYSCGHDFVLCSTSYLLGFWESMVLYHDSHLDRLLPKSLFAWSKTLFDKSKACSRRFQNSPFGLKQLKSLTFRFAKIY